MTCRRYSIKHNHLIILTASWCCEHLWIGHEDVISVAHDEIQALSSTTKSLPWITKQLLCGDTYVITDIQNSVGCLAVSVASREARSTSVWRASLKSQCICKKREDLKAKPTVTFQRERTEKQRSVSRCAQEVCSRKKRILDHLNNFLNMVNERNTSQSRHVSATQEVKT